MNGHIKGCGKDDAPLPSITSLQMASPHQSAAATGTRVAGTVRRPKSRTEFSSATPALRNLSCLIWATLREIKFQFDLTRTNQVVSFPNYLARLVDDCEPLPYVRAASKLLRQFRKTSP